MDHPDPPWVCLVTPTVMSGAVVRWHTPEDTGAGNPLVEPAISASRDGVRIGTYLHLIPPAILDQANEAYESLRRNGPRETIARMATHRRRRASGPLEPVDRDAIDRFLDG